MTDDTSTDTSTALGTTSRLFGRQADVAPVPSAPEPAPDVAPATEVVVNTASTVEESQARGEPLVIRPFSGR